MVMNFVAGRYVVRYGRVASEVVKKQMAQIPGGLVKYLFCLHWQRHQKVNIYNEEM